MTRWVHAALRLRRAIRLGLGVIAAAGFGALIAMGYLSQPAGLVHGMFGIAWCGIVGARLYASRRTRQRQEFRVTVEMGLLSLVAAHGALETAGGWDSPLYPLLYVWAAVVGAFAARRDGFVLLAVAFGFGTLLHVVRLGFADVASYALHHAFLLGFGLLTLVFTRLEIVRLRLRSRHERDQEQKKMQFESRLLRLAGGRTNGGESQTEERLYRSSLDEVHNQLYHILSLLHRALDLHTAVLLMLDDRGETMRIVELVTDSDDIAEGPFGVGEGAVGAVAQRALMTNLEHVRPGYPGLCYYRGPAMIRAFLGVPVIEGGNVRGALCVDRIDDRPFGPKEEMVMAGAASQLVRSLENERVFLQLERSKNEMTILYRASQALGAALDEEAVIEAGLAAAREIAPFDFAATSLFDPATRKHTVRKAVGESAAKFEGLTFRDNASLTAMVVKNRHYLPYRGDFDPDQQTVYTRKANLATMESLLILPLVVRETAFGTIAFAAHRANAFPESVRPTLQVLANQVSVALSNAASVRRLEEMATTDGLTGCLNKRAFREELGRKLRAAERFERPVSLIVTDLDHFKSVNDTYGHATGDLVLRELGNILRRMKRETDSVARFGGEEFCVLCEETDTEGAIQLAERVREALEATVFQTEMGQLQLTCSLGVATFPVDARTEEDFFEAADRALYQAKNMGRNRVCAARKARAA